MKSKNQSRRGVFILFFPAFFCSAVLGQSPSWKNVHLLDSQTQKELKNYDAFFDSLFQLPAEYDGASQENKKQIAEGWIRQIQDSNCEQAVAAAAWLGIIRLPSAAKPLEQVLRKNPCGGRQRWVCSRSLAQIADPNSIPLLETLLEDQNANTRVYARAGLAEITGAGENSEKWIALKKSTSSPNDPNQHTVSVQQLRRLIDQNYSYRDRLGLNWDALFEQYRSRMEKAPSREAFAEAAAEMLAHARDMHLWVKIEDQGFGGFKRTCSSNYNLSWLKQNIPEGKELSPDVYLGRFGRIGYLLIASWKRDEERVLKPALEGLKQLMDCPALILDVRPNSGGSEPFAGQIAGCFTEKEVVYAKHMTKLSGSPDKWSAVQERVLKPDSRMPVYRGQVVVLMGQENMSSCESFLLMMKQTPNCKLMGQRSYGSSGNSKPYPLANGVTVWLPSWKDLRPDVTCFEGEGLKPDLLVQGREDQFRSADPVLERALQFLQRGLKLPPRKMAEYQMTGKTSGN